MNKTFDAEEIVMVFAILGSINPSEHNITDPEDPEAAAARAVWYKLRAACNAGGVFTTEDETTVVFEAD